MDTEMEHTYIADGEGQPSGNLKFSWSLLQCPQISSVGSTQRFWGSLEGSPENLKAEHKAWL